MPGQDIKHEVFNCSKIGVKVTITLKILIHRSSATREIDARFTSPIDCDHTSECGVAKSSGRSIDYDWKQCVHPDLKQ